MAEGGTSSHTGSSPLSSTHLGRPSSAYISNSSHHNLHIDERPSSAPAMSSSSTDTPLHRRQQSAQSTMEVVNEILQHGHTHTSSISGIPSSSNGIDEYQYEWEFDYDSEEEERQKHTSDDANQDAPLTRTPSIRYSSKQQQQSQQGDEKSNDKDGTWKQLRKFWHTAQHIRQVRVEEQAAVDIMVRANGSLQANLRAEANFRALEREIAHQPLSVFYRQKRTLLLICCLFPSSFLNNVDSYFDVLSSPTITIIGGENGTLTWCRTFSGRSSVITL
jgi:hypothetical protein